MASSPSPFFTNPAWGAGFSNLARAFVPQPGEADLADQRRAAAEHSRIQAEEIQRRMAGRQSYADRLRQGGLTPEAQREILAAGVGSGASELAPHISELQRTFVFSQQPDAATGANAFQGAGGSYANTQPGFQAHEGTLRRGQDSSAGATLGAARIGAGAQIERERMQQSGADRRMTLNLAPGNVGVVPENSPLAGLAGPGGRIEGNMRPTTMTQAQAEAAQAYINAAPEGDARVSRQREVALPGVARQEAANSGRVEQITLQGQQGLELQNLRGAQASGRLDTQGAQRLQQLELQNSGRLDQTALQNSGRLDQITLQGQQGLDLQQLRGTQASGRLDTRGAQRLQELELQNSGRATAAANRPPLDVSPGEASTLTATAARLLGHSVDNTGKPNGAIDLSPQALAWIQNRAASLYQETRDAGSAAAKAAGEFRNAYEQDNPGSPMRATVPGYFGSRTAVDLPPSLRAASAQTVPPPAQRQVGQVYQTPRGPMIWSGTGWRPAS